MESGWRRNATLFLASQNISFLGSMLVQHAITWHITLTTQSGSMITIAIICGFLPTFFLSPFAGVWADRYNRRLLIAAADSVIAVATLALAVLFALGHDALWLLFAASAIRSLGAGVQMPAVGAFLPQIVPQEKLTRVNATNGTLQSVVSLLSPVLGGALLAVLPIESVFLIDVVTAAIAVGILVIALRVPAHPKALDRAPARYYAELRAGMKYVGKHGFLKAFFLYSAIFFILVGPVAFLTPLHVTRVFGDQVWRLAALEAGFSIGMILGGIAMASWGGFRNKTHSMVLSMVIFGACTLAIGVAPTFWLYIGFMGLLGVAMPVFNTPAMVLLQEKVEGDYLGRVFGVQTMIATSLMPLGMLFYGPLADAIPVEWLLVSTGLLMLLICIGMGRNRELIEAGKSVIPA